MSGSGRAPALGRRAMTTGMLSVPLLPLLPLLAGCSGDDVVDLPGLPRLGEDPDEPLLDAALEAEGAVWTFVDEVRRRHRSLRALLRSAHEVHGQHVDLLREATGKDGDFLAVTWAAPRSPQAALDALVRREQRVATQHVQRAVEARSGPFARLMAVLAAAATQQSVVLAQAAADLPRGRS